MMMLRLLCLSKMWNRKPTSRNAREHEDENSILSSSLFNSPSESTINNNQAVAGEEPTKPHHELRQYAAPVLHKNLVTPLVGGENDVIVKELNGKQLHLLHDDLFDDIVAYKESGYDYDAARRHFAPAPFADALVRAVYNRFRIDYVLEHSLDEKDNKEVRHKGRITKFDDARKAFIKGLLLAGFCIEQEKSAVDRKMYTKLSMPFDALASEAQEIKLMMDLKNTTSHVGPKGGFFNKIFNLFGDKENENGDYASGRFRVEKISQFVGGDVSPVEIQDSFFNSGKRLLLAYNQLIHVNIAKFKNIKKAGIRHLLSKGVYTKCYSIHDGPIKPKAGQPANLRSFLFETWVSKFFDAQPLTQVRAYFGEKIALYFAWLGFYTQWLLYAGIIGVLVFIYGISEASGDITVPKYANRSFTYDPNNNDTLIAVPESTVRFSILFDNSATPWFALIMSVWATLFLEFWKRRNAQLAFQWDVMDFEKEEPTRPQWYGTHIRESPISGKQELYYPNQRFMTKVIISTGVVLLAIAIVVATVGGNVIFRAFINYTYPANSSLSWVSSVVPAIVSLISIMILSFLYQDVARIFTDWENHRTETEYEDALIFKTFLFDFVNSYSSLFYVAYFKYQPTIPDSIRIIGRYTDTCSYSSCLVELTVQLAIVFLGKQFINQAVEVGVPYVKRVMNERAAKAAEAKNLEDLNAPPGELEKQKMPTFIKESLLNVYDSVLGDYDEMVLQFGFITLFVAAFPLAPIFAFMNNVIELRSDAFKILVESQRPPALQAQDLGTWYNILDSMSMAAVISNAFLIAFSSRYLDDTLFSDYTTASDRRVGLVPKLVFIIVFELLFAAIIPDVPADVQEAMDREEYLAKMALAGGSADEDDEPDDVVEEGMCLCV